MMTKAKPCHVGNQLTINRNCTGGGIKRLTSLFKLFSALILCATLFNPIVSLAQSGSGTESDPYIISSINDWNFFAKKVQNGESPYSSASYKVTADINCSLIYEWGQLHWPNWNSEGNGLYQFGTESNLFTGTLDFDGHTFDTIAIADAQQQTKVGLFHIGVGGVVKNLTFSGYVYLNENNNIDIGVVAGTNQGTIENCKISDVDISNWGNNYAAGICVLNAVSGTVKNCTVENSKIGKAQTTVTVGGICAVNAGTIDGCEVSNLTLNAKEGQDQGNVGGICGVSSNKIVDCDASSIDIKSGGNAGGICGMMSGTLSGCEVKDLAYVSNSACNFGGICGHMNENSTISQCVLSGSNTTLKSEGNV
ncbi:MAG: hypothetical protein IJ250_06520, partial [Bacteroidales bacterium]|nr:hypothetical protein [Bacteroidales bacterium]